MLHEIQRFSLVVVPGQLLVCLLEPIQRQVSDRNRGVVGNKMRSVIYIAELNVVRIPLRRKTDLLH